MKYTVKFSKLFLVILLFFLLVFLGLELYCVIKIGFVDSLEIQGMCLAAVLGLIIKIRRLAKFHSKSRLSYDEQRIEGYTSGNGETQLLEKDLKSISTVTRKRDNLIIVTEGARTYVFPCVMNAKEHSKRLREFVEQAKKVNK